MNNTFSVVIFTTIIFQWLVYQGEAFSANTATLGRRVGRITALNAWSLPNPSEQSSFRSLTNTWYNEVNPTARTTVYNDIPVEFKFMRLGDDWPSIGDSPSVLETVKPRRRLSIPNPLRRLVQARRRPTNQL